MPTPVRWLGARATGWRLPARAALLPLALCLLPWLVGSPAAWQSPAAPAAVQQTKPPFEDWLAAVRAEAVTRGIRETTLDAALAGLAPDPIVLERERTQPETTQTLEQYLDLRLTKKTILAAQTMYDEHLTLLDQIRQTYGIPPALMVAIWGVESNFGQITGSRPTVASLATLAYDGKRPALFRSELFHALTIIDKGLAPAADLKGSWAGAMGQPQFMPSSYLKYAIDFDGDGRADIWTSLSDVFASMANYLKVAGWTEEERWGREVRVTGAALTRIEQSVSKRSSGCGAVKDLTVARPLTEWTDVGVTLPEGDPLPTASLKASLVHGKHRFFLVYRNYEALLAYNCSNSYALTVGLLSDTVGVK